MDGKRWSSLGFASLICKKALNRVISCWFYDAVIVESPKEGGEGVGYSMDTRPRRKGNHKTIKKGSGLELGLELFQIPSLHAQESLKRSS